MSRANFSAAILDLDGVITRTASQHGRAWKEMFDTFLEHRSPREGEDHSPFDEGRDYLRYVDGKPRLDGVRGFLASRGIELPEEGRSEASGEDATIHQLGCRKNDIFLKLLEREPVETFGDAVEVLERWRREGLGTALITSSRNGRRILGAVGLETMFDVIVDGNDAARLGIRGKPAPDIFLHAARELGVSPGDAVVVEDAISGVAAARAGGFGLVVGVARGGGDEVREALRDAGADVVTSDLRSLYETPPTEPRKISSEPQHALERIERFADRLGERQLALFLDYDGTLTPIVRRPEEATLSEEMRTLLRDLAARVTVGIISGRDLADVRGMVGLEELYYAGSHGFDVAGPGGLRMQQRAAQEYIPTLDTAERDLREGLEQIEGAWVERKHFAIAVHYRETAEADVERVGRAVDAVHASHPRLRRKGGKKIIELQPDVPWDKGRAVLWLLDQLDLAHPEVLPVYVGDDVTDEDAFAALRGRGLSIRVGPLEDPTGADFHLRDVGELERFCRALLDLLDDRGRTDG